MKRIVFLLNKMPEKAIIDEYIEYADEYETNILCINLNEGLPGSERSLSDGNDNLPGFEPDFEDVICTDSSKAYLALKEREISSIVSLSNLDDSAMFPGAKYLLLDAFDTEIEYYERVWKRFKNIPWTICETEHLLVRETTVEDVDEFVKIFSDPAVFKYTEPLYEDIEEERKYAREYIEKVYSVQGFGIWTLIEKESGKVIGRAGVVTREGFEGVELGYIIGSEYQRRGFATEAVMACIVYTKEYNLSPVRCFTMRENIASTRLLLRCGFQKKGSVVINYTEYDEYLLG